MSLKVILLVVRGCIVLFAAGALVVGCRMPIGRDPDPEENGDNETAPESPLEFHTIWNTANTTGDSSGSDQIALPLVTGGTYDFTVDWGDGTQDEITSSDDPAVTHTYAESGVYEIVITGEIVGFAFSNSGDRDKLIEIRSWGPLRLGNTGGHFHGASNLEITATDILDLSGTTDMRSAFNRAEQLTTVPNMGEWDFSAVTRTSHMFSGVGSFNEEIGGWELSSVTDMRYKFNNASSFNHDIGDWDVSSVTHMGNMFSGAEAFNRDLDEWDTSQVTSMGWMFSEATAFNGQIGTWAVSDVSDMRHMFRNAESFNQDIGGWTIDEVKDMDSAFRSASAFDQDIGDWNVSGVTDMRYMFAHAEAFDQDIGGWQVSDVEDMQAMFWSATAFNQDISEWEVPSVENMRIMFRSATAFDQDVGGWNVTSVGDMTDMFHQSGLTTASYEALLEGWAGLADDLQSEVELGVGTVQYSSAAQEYRDILTNPAGPAWTITDGGVLD